ncbi:hypothetical protein HYQ44_008042 [Verticillium longisporum]|nr:hypothetical protein HYQ44_008042 [Verticillium longisporum]
MGPRASANGSFARLESIFKVEAFFTFGGRPLGRPSIGLFSVIVVSHTEAWTDNSPSVSAIAVALLLVRPDGACAGFVTLFAAGLPRIFLGVGIFG